MKKAVHPGTAAAQARAGEGRGAARKRAAAGHQAPERCLIHPHRIMARYSDGTTWATTRMPRGACINLWAAAPCVRSRESRIRIGRSSHSPSQKCEHDWQEQPPRPSDEFQTENIDGGHGLTLQANPAAAAFNPAVSRQTAVTPIRGTKSELTRSAPRAAPARSALKRRAGTEAVPGSAAAAARGNCAPTRPPGEMSQEDAGPAQELRPRHLTQDAQRGAWGKAAAKARRSRPASGRPAGGELTVYGRAPRASPRRQAGHETDTTSTDLPVRKTRTASGRRSEQDDLRGPRLQTPPRSLTLGTGRRRQRRPRGGQRERPAENCAESPELAQPAAQFVVVQDRVCVRVQGGRAGDRAVDVRHAVR